MFGGGKAEDKVRRHVVRRIDYVLIADLCCKDRNGTGFSSRKITIRINRESSWTTRYGGIGDIMCSALRADDLEPVASNINGFTKRDGDVGILCYFGGAVCGSCAGNAWRSIDVECYESSVVWS